MGELIFALVECLIEILCMGASVRWFFGLLLLSIAICVGYYTYIM
ncbi:hypothetical protein [Yersinia phage fHe-Yen9-04]|uniref:Uncharacterized protein n=2 Tax=Eneladusvirus Yen904 TaxID=2560849 RepID=A0A2C9CX46_9CAUD|nr:membrane protein [Yersinia phage fHe-Yen9-04]SOK58390.1 hypothetical protein [Yersinia phage fHe-Yen9-04]SOK58925.1 hypothetical protein [Yersinia phage fHe-Yen9-03]VUE36159.1 hypothetical protein [Yersinia phage fHe-Yen9-04]